MYTILYGKFFFLKKLRLMYLKFFFIVFKIFLLFLFWSFIFIFLLAICIIIYKFTHNYINNLFGLNGYLNIIEYIIKKEISKKENNSYIIYYSDEEIVEESLSKSTEFFIDNPNNEKIEFIDDFYEIFINTGNINCDIILSDHLDVNNNLIKEFTFSENEEQIEFTFSENEEQIHKPYKKL